MSVANRLRALAVLVLMAPLTARIAPAAPEDMGTVPTGAGFSLSIARESSALYPTAVRLQASGLPAFPRHARRTSQVIVGPYAAIDEAETLQRTLRRSGFPARLLVDESVRRVSGADVALRAQSGAGVLLVSGGGRLSLVIELPEEPRKVITEREGSALKVDALPVLPHMSARRWRAPAGVEVFRHVTLYSVGSTLHARLDLSDTTRTIVRLVGTRIYIDLWSLESEMITGRGFAPRKVVAMAQTEMEEIAAAPYDVQIGPALARFQQMEPFILSSVSAPSPDVLKALEGSLRGLESRIQEIEAPAESAQVHASLVASVRLATEAVDPAFPGDRGAHAKRAFELAASAHAAGR